MIMAKHMYVLVQRLCLCALFDQTEKGWNAEAAQAAVPASRQKGRTLQASTGIYRGPPRLLRVLLDSERSWRCQACSRNDRRQGAHSAFYVRRPFASTSLIPFGKRQNVWPVYQVYTPVSVSDLPRNLSHDAFGPHVMTGLDVLHRRGFNGAGITVAVVDSGVDYRHPDLGGCFGKGCKVVRGQSAPR